MNCPCAAIQYFSIYLVGRVSGSHSSIPFSFANALVIEKDTVYIFSCETALKLVSIYLPELSIELVIYTVAI